ncbi:DUF3592 domain-containing protein [Naumannella cuiyingiana]|uniref:DUF3592 domain-containing protein n=1 Tax=Naumannella cuiyingiana TaxID=1347891 RepID=A0A7Z0IJF1_9ACTN|nr:DUF3592 domain-containing protein [Naumannella cuiyingiana]NYI69469.1 hypothetical protein [Naumannella cuiyingiana]
MRNGIPDFGTMVTMIRVVAAVVGAAFVLMGWSAMRRARALRRDGVRASGQVVALDVDHDWSMDRGASVSYPVVEFALRDGRIHRARSDVGSSPAPAREGDQVTVYYDPADPDRFTLDGPGNAIGPLLAAVGALVLLGAAIGPWLLTAFG